MVTLSADLARVESHIVDRHGTLLSTANYGVAVPEVRTAVALDPATGAAIMMHTLSQQPGALTFTRLLP